MRRTTLTSLTAAAVLLSLGVSQAIAQEHEAQRPSREAMKAAITEIGVAPGEMRSCMKSQRSKMNPDQKPTETERAELRDAIYNCLAKANPNLTRDSFDTAMAKLRPSKN